MFVLRRRLASCALALLICQTAAVFAAPLSSCCTARHAAAVEAEPDCCPAGSHLPGECPRHAGASRAQSKRACRVQCDAPHGMEFFIAAVGVLPAPFTSAVAVSSTPFALESALTPDLRASIPQSPPPRVR